MDKRAYVWRIRLVLAGIVLCALTLLVKLYIVQIIEGKEFVQRANHQYVQPLQTLFDRGTIYFTDKDGSLSPAATVKTGLDVIMNPRLMTTSAQSVYDKLSTVISLDQSTFTAKMDENATSSYVELAKRIPEAQGDTLSALQIPGLSLSDDNWRYYPAGSLASHVLGLVGYEANGNTLAGRYGLESYYDSVLERDDNDSYVNFFAQIFSNIDNAIQTKDSSAEGDIVTTIEPTIQGYVEKELQGVEDTWHSDMSGAIVMDPHTGDIYAMAANPTFDPNNPQDQSSSAIFSNPLVENVYEMGSIVKALTMSAGLDSGAVSTTTTYDDTGFINVDGYKVSNYDGVARGVIPMQQILNQSLNVGAAWVENKMGTTTFASYMRNFGLGEKTGIDLPNEATGLISNLESPRQVEYATASFGQGIAVTPLEVARALSALANGGVLPSPHIVSQINYQVGLTKTMTFPPGRQVISKKTADTITGMLINVVDQALLNGTVKLTHYSIAAKTGTAQISEGHGLGYYPDRYLHSFFGYFPAHDPRFIVFLYTVYPKGAEYASETLTPTFMDIAKYLINYYAIPPDR